MSINAPEAIATWAIGGGLTDAQAAIAVAIALAESGGDDEAVGDVALQDATWGPSVGMYQIRTLKKPKSSDPWYRNRKNIEGNPQQQTNGMIAISGKGTNWSAWTTYTTGAYLAFLLKAQQGVQVAHSKYGATDMTGWDAGEAIGETIPGDKGDPIGAIGDTVKGIASGVTSVADFVALLSDPKFVQRATKVLGGGAVVLTGLVLLNKDLVMTAANVLPVGRAVNVASAAASAVKKTAPVKGS